MPTPSYATADLLATPSFAAAAATGYDPWAIPDTADAFAKRFFFWGWGQANAVFDGSTFKAMGITAPQTAPTLSTIAGTITGKPWVTYTYADDAAGVESGPQGTFTTIPYWTQTTLAAQGLRVAVPNPPAASTRVTHAYVYIGLLPDTIVMKYHGKIAVTPGAGGTVNYDIAGLTNATLEANTFLSMAKRFYADGAIPASWTAAFWNGQLFIVDPAHPNVVLYSEDALPEDFPTSNLITILPSPEDPNPYIVALRNNQDRLYVYTNRGGYEITGSAPLFKVYPAFSGIGAVSTSATRYIEGTGVVFPGFDKVYVHVGGSDIRPLGAPKGNPGANAIDDLYLASDFGIMRDACGIVDPETSSYRFSMPELGAAAPDTSAVWEYAKNDWGEDTGRTVTCWGRWSDVSGRQRLVRGDDRGGVWQEEMGNSEGYWGAVFSGTITSVPTRTSLNVGVVAFDSTLIQGMPVVLKNSSGTVLYRNRATLTGPGTIGVLYPWPVADLTALIGLTVEVGSIEGVWQSGWTNVSPAGFRGCINYIDPYLVVNAGGTIRVLCGVNQNTTFRVAAAAMSVALWRDHISFNDMGNEVAVRFDGSSPGTDWALRGYAVFFTQKPSPV